MAATRLVGSGTFASADRKSTRLNSSPSQISDAVFCLKKKTRLHPFTPSHVPSGVSANTYGYETTAITPPSLPSSATTVRADSASPDQTQPARALERAL